MSIIRYVSPQFIHAVSSIVIALASLSAAPAEQKQEGPVSGLSLRIVVANQEAGIGIIPYDQQFRVFIRNSTDREIRLWSSIYLRGQTMMSFPIRDSSGRCSVMRRSDTDPADWEGCPLDTFSIPPRETFTTWYVWPKNRRWTGVPAPDTGKNVTMRALLAIKPSDEATQAGVWTGRVESPPITARFVSPDLDSPHEYLKERCPKRAIEMMKADPKWLRKLDNYQRTPLHVAARYGPPAAVQWLIANGADVNAVAYNRFTPLHVAGDVEVVKLLVKHGANLEAVAVAGTPLQDHALFHPDRQHLAKQLLDAGAYYDILSAACMGDADRVRKLLDADPNKAKDKNVMRQAARRGHAAIVKLLLSHGADPDDADYGGLPVLYFAVEHPAVVRLLTDAGADATARVTYVGSGLGPQDSTLLHAAAEKGNVETARILIDEGVEVDAKDVGQWTPLDCAARHGQIEMVRFLLRAGRDKLTLPDDGAGPMSIAASKIWPSNNVLENKRYAEVVRVLHDHGVPIDLYTAISLGDTQRAVALLEANPTLANSKDARGYPTLLRAVDLDRQEIVASLLKNGCDVDIRNDYRGTGTLGGTALHAAAFWGYTDIARILLDQGAEVDATAKDGFTPLHKAARCRNLGVARLLLAAGANVNAKDDQSRTPLYWAVKRGGGEPMIELLRQHGARKAKIAP